MDNRLKTLALCMLSSATLANAQTFLSDTQAMKRIQTTNKYVLLPVEESENLAHIRVIKDNNVVKEFNCKLAVNKVDYSVPLDVSEFGGDVLLDIQFTGEKKNTGSIQYFTCWKELKETNSFDTSNREKYRPLYHHTPPYGWMNDPNGIFYKDGVWHLYFQYNPFGSQWENMNWGHSTSRDLIHWTYVDKDNAAGFGKNAVIAFYTSAGTSQTQSIAYSLDNGKTFTKYAGNPIVTSNVPDFRDPKVFWNEDTQLWNLILAAGQQMSIYSSKNLKDWTFESHFGEGYGNHDGVWECPDLIKMGNKWVLLCNINPGGPYGGSATQYFVGHFDGHKFTCESAPTVTKWLDYGKDQYATVTFNNAPNGRIVAIPWMSNWQYGNHVPTLQFRSANGLPRELGLFSYQGESYISVKPSPEVFAAFSNKISTKLQPASYIEVTNIKGNASITLKNNQNEEVVMVYDAKKGTFSMDRNQSGVSDFSSEFKTITTSPTYGAISGLQIFVDKSSVEVFDVDGKMAMTNIVFPTSPYTDVVAKGCKVKIHALK